MAKNEGCKMYTSTIKIVRLLYNLQGVYFE